MISSQPDLIKVIGRFQVDPQIYDRLLSRKYTFSLPSILLLLLESQKYSLQVKHSPFSREKKFARSQGQHNLDGVWLSCLCHLFFSPARLCINTNIYGGAETNNEFLGKIGTELWTSLGDGDCS